MSNGLIPAIFTAGASILILDTVTGKTKRVHIKNKSKVKVIKRKVTKRKKNT